MRYRGHNLQVDLTKDGLALEVGRHADRPLDVMVGEMRTAMAPGENRTFSS